MTKYDFIKGLIELFNHLDGKSDAIKEHNLDRFVEHFLLNLNGVNRSLPTSKEPFALIMDQINKNTKDVLEAIKEMRIVRIHNGPA